ncbi:hypothetical protein BJP36_36025 [Moorena producens JHB]|uniref:Uncharacterized protein n=1 Tax=Moorena producens (strain JHB) TaxID=1454205 RepID=A0A9Q9STT9_MOOP1|nr:hypothetical protein [Moorena producens]WAN69503.1 hypothetical protein BJP36_36025 [Moorena producens JHB]
MRYTRFFPYCLLPIAYCLLPIASCLFPVPHLPISPSPHLPISPPSPKISWWNSQDCV